MRIGFIGVGVMGNGMVANLLKNGFDVDVFTRTKEKAARALEAGARWADDIRECVSEADAVITIVGSWNAFLLPLLVLIDPSQHTLPIGVNNISAQYSTDYAVVLAYTIVAMTTTAEFAVYTVIGLAVYHLSPLILPLANVVMYPVEAGFRWMFRWRAANTLRRVCSPA